MKRTVRVFIIFVCFFLVFFNYTYAVETDELQSIDEYAEQILPTYLSLASQNYGSVGVSQGFCVYGSNNSTTKIFVVTEKGIYIGRLVIAVDEDRFVSSFVFEECNALTEAISQEREIAFVVEDEQVFFCTEDLILNLSQQNSIENVNTSSLVMEKIIWKEIQITDKTRSIESEPLIASVGVPLIENATAPDGRGVCWAACLASILNYRTGSTYSALGVYDALDSQYTGTPEGADVWYTRGYSLRGLSATLTTNLSCAELYAKLYSGVPVIFRINRTVASHAIVLNYIFYGDTRVTMGFMDPNEDDTVFMTFDVTGFSASDFYYTNAYHTYSEWHGTVY